MSRNKKSSSRNVFLIVIYYSGDIERSVQRITLNRGGPRDIAVLANTLSHSNDLYNILVQTDMCKIPNLKNIVESLSPKLEQYTKLLPDILNAFNLEVYFIIIIY